VSLPIKRATSKADVMELLKNYRSGREFVDARDAQRLTTRPVLDLPVL